jgi:hypothetical protein
MTFLTIRGTRADRAGNACTKPSLASQLLSLEMS